MAILPASGPLSINDFNVAMDGALGFSSGRSTGLNDLNVRVVANKLTGAVSLSDLRGKHVVRPSNPITFASPLINQATGLDSSGHYTVRFEILDTGYIVCEARNSSGTAVYNFQTNWLLPATSDNFSLMNQFTISVVRSAWNGVGVVNTGLATEDWGLRGNFILLVEKSGASLPDATYVVTLTDKFNPANNVGFYIRLAII